MIYASSIATSSFLKDTFLASYSSCEVALFCSRTLPIWTWSFESEILLIKWSMHRPGVFFVLDQKGVIQVFDLIQSINEPCRSSALWNIAITCFELSSEASVMYISTKKDGVKSYTLCNELIEPSIDEANEIIRLINGA
jgi:hypothetical protein